MIRRTAIKFCGLTRAVDVDAAVAIGVDYIGLVLAEGSPRRLQVAQARALALRARAKDSSMRIVALVRDAESAFLESVVADVAPDLLQFHGSEDGAACAAFGLPYWKAIGMLGGVPSEVASRHPAASALLLDAHVPGAAGGTGHTFDWARWPDLGLPLVLAGGLDAANVGDAIRATHPFAVDTSSGIESSPGIKDAEKMRAFAAAVRIADAGKGTGERDGPDVPRRRSR